MRTLFVAFLALLPLSAAAQLDAGNHPVYQDGVQVGVVYVAPGQDSCKYVEHWYLFAGYEFPTVANGLDLTVVAGEVNPSMDADSFLAAMREHYPGGRAIESSSVETRADCP